MAKALMWFQILFYKPSCAKYSWIFILSFSAEHWAKRDMETTTEKKSTKIFQFWPKIDMACSSDVNTTPNHPHVNMVSDLYGFMRIAS